MARSACLGVLAVTLAGANGASAATVTGLDLVLVDPTNVPAVGDLPGGNWVANGYPEASLDTYRVYVVTDGPETILGVGDLFVGGLRLDVISSDGSFHNDATDSDETPVDMTPSYWSNQWDTFLTVAGVPIQLLFLEEQLDGMTGNFQIDNAGWYDVPPPTGPNTDASNRALIMQLTVSEGQIPSGDDLIVTTGTVNTGPFEFGPSVVAVVVEKVDPTNVPAVGTLPAGNWVENGYPADQLDTFRVYVQVNGPMRVLAVGDLFIGGLLLEVTSTNGAFVNAAIDSDETPINLTPADWTNQWDTFVTIAGGPVDPTDGLLEQLAGMTGDFGVDNTGWVVIPVPGRPNSDASNRVLIMQLTVAKGQGVAGDDFIITSVRTVNGANYGPFSFDFPATTGACCFGAGLCQELTALDCSTAAGFYGGDGTQCAPACFGACCLEDQSCEVLEGAACATAGGTYFEATPCDPSLCLTGACCLLDGSCTFTSEANCIASIGLFMGASLSCSAVVCPTPGLVLSEEEVGDGIGGFPIGPLDAGDDFGAGAASIGDVNGDLIPELAIGAPGDDDGGDANGAAWVLFMNANGTVSTTQKISALSGGFGGALSGDAFGRAVAGLGDLDGDGTPDVAIGADLDDDGAPDAGAIWILFLDETGAVTSQQKISAAQGGFGGSLAAGDGFGADIAVLGDLDGDGIVELAVGAPGDSVGESDQGAVWIIFLNPNGTVQSQQRIGEGTAGFPGPLAANDRFGWAVSAIDDLDGDGVVDLAVGAPNDDDGPGFDHGAIWVLFLNTNGTVAAQQKISRTSGDLGVLIDAGDRFGSGLAAPGDLNGDGFPDVAVGAPGDDDAGSAAGAFYLLFLDEDGTVRGRRKATEGVGGFAGDLTAGDALGAAISEIGDLDGDGISDVVVSAPRGDLSPLGGGLDAGALWVLFLDGFPDVTFPQIVEAAASGPGDNEATGDLDEDGDPDVVVLLPLTDQAEIFWNLGTDVGGTWLGFEPVTTLLLTGASPSGIAIGDIDGDTHLDVAVSNEADDTFTVFFGDGMRGFTASTGSAGLGASPSAIVTGDLANDGTPPFEIALTNRDNDEVVVFEPTSPLAAQDSIVWQAVAQIPVGDQPLGLIEPEDVDDDKDIDLVVVNHGDDTVAVIPWQSGQPQTPFTVPVGGAPLIVEAGDLDGDGLPEIATANEDDGTLSILRNATTEAGLPAFAPAQPEVVGANPSAVSIADLDGDDDNDVAVTAEDVLVGAAVRILENHSDETIVLSPPVSYPIAAEPNYVVDADMDGDGLGDLVTANSDADQPSGGSVTVLISLFCGPDTDGDGTVGFNDITQILLNWGPCPPAPAACPWDVNEDGNVGFVDVTEVLLGWGDCQ